MLSNGILKWYVCLLVQNKGQVSVWSW